MKFIWVLPSLYAQSQKVIPVVLQHSACLLSLGSAVRSAVTCVHASVQGILVLEYHFGLGIKGAQLVFKNCPREWDIYRSDGRVFD